MTRSRAPERGIALAASLLVLVVVAALVAGFFFAALQEFRIGQNSVRAQRAFGAAEAGLELTLASWDAARLDRLGTNETAAFGDSLPNGAGAYSGVVQRLNPQLFLVRSTGREADGSSQKTLAVVARLVPITVVVTAALAAAGDVKIGAAGLVDGVGGEDGGWSCPGARDTVAGVLIGDVSRLTASECGASPCIRGRPGVREDTTLRHASVPLLGEAGWASLASLASAVVVGGPASRLASGLGSPPVVYVDGDLRLAGGSWQGVLLVQGNLVVDGGTHLVGLVVVRGTLVMRGAGGVITGGVLAGGAEVGGAAEEGQAVVAYSGCAVRQALAAAAPAVRLKERAWAELFWVPPKA